MCAFPSSETRTSALKQHAPHLWCRKRQVDRYISELRVFACVRTPEERRALRGRQYCIERQRNERFKVCRRPAFGGGARGERQRQSQRGAVGLNSRDAKHIVPCQLLFPFSDPYRRDFSKFHPSHCLLLAALVKSPRTHPVPNHLAPVTAVNGPSVASRNAAVVAAEDARSVQRQHKQLAERVIAAQLCIGISAMQCLDQLLSQ